MVEQEKIVDSICNVLIEKNKRYGNSALKPKHYFYKGNSTDSIAIRMDDKISRIKNSDNFRKNDVFDLLGYLMLYSISLNYFGTNKDNQFLINVDVLKENMYGFSYDEKDNSFDCTYYKNQINRTLDVIHEIDENVVDKYLVYNLMYYIVGYFVKNNDVDFSELID